MGKKSDKYTTLARDLALHVAALKPQYVSKEEVPSELVEREKEIALAQLSEQQREKADKILPGKLEKYYEEIVLLQQPYVKDDSGKQTVADLIHAYSLKCGEKVVVRRFARWEVGEGIEKSETNFAAEVAALTN
jgi:elongation factor Ts